MHKIQILMICPTGNVPRGQYLHWVWKWVSAQIIRLIACEPCAKVSFNNRREKCEDREKNPINVIHFSSKQKRAYIIFSLPTSLLTRKMSLPTSLLTRKCPTYIPNYSKSTPPPVKFYRDRACSGTKWEVHPNKSSKTPSPMDDNSVTSVQVPPNVKLTMYQNKDYEGERKTFNSGNHYPLDWWNDTVSSYKVSSIVPHSTWLKNCCLGKTSPASDCSNFRDENGADCKSLLDAHCRLKKNFFSSDCKRWLQNLNSQRKNDIARAVCTGGGGVENFKWGGSPTYSPTAKTYSPTAPTAPTSATPESYTLNSAEKEWCACFIARDLPPELENDMAIKAMWPCLDPVCNDSTLSLQPYQKSCPNTLNICKQSDITTKMSESDIGAQRIANECGNVNIGQPAPAPAPAPAPPADRVGAGAGGETGLSTGMKIGVGVGGGVLLLIIVILIVVVLKKKKIKR